MFVKTSSGPEFSRGFVPIVVVLAVAALGGFVLFTSVGRFAQSRIQPGVLGEEETDKTEHQNESKDKKVEVKPADSTENREPEDKKEVSGSSEVKGKVENEHGKFKLKYELKDGEMEIKAEDEKGEELEIPDEDLDKLEDEVGADLEDEGVEIASREGKLAFSKNNVEATTHFPLSVDVATNQLIVTTPAGQRVVTVLPDQAIQNLLRANVISQVATQSAGALELKFENGKMVYEVSGSKEFRLFTLIPVSAPLKVIVSAESGSVVTTELPFLTNLLSLLSR